MLEAGQSVLATRADAAAFAAIQAAAPDARYIEIARLVMVGEPAPMMEAPPVVVLTAGTSDIPVAEEAAHTCEFLGSPVERIYDAGVAGLSRLLSQLERLRAASVIIAVAGMDGALPGVTAGLVGCPVLAVPTSTGYGTAMGGLAALGTMLNACAPGLSVLNIDNGYGAACQAQLIQKIYAGRA
jgi:NCAIR mutase (PurE)-related protein